MKVACVLDACAMIAFLIRWAQFTPQKDIPLLKALALTNNSDVNVLLMQDDILTIA